MKRAARLCSIPLLCIAAVLATCGSAFAGSIMYDIAASPLYTVDNAQGIVKITYTGCVTQSQLQTVNFTTIIEGATAGSADYKVLQTATDHGELPTATFTPATVTVIGPAKQSVATKLTFTLSTVSTSGTVFRFKLGPESGIGLGEGPGVAVIINCVQPDALQSPAGPPVAGGKVVPTVPVPTATAGVAAGPSSCVSIRRVTLRAHKRSRVVVVVRDAAGALVQRAYVRITGPGIRKAAFTNAQGLAVFTVRPTRRGYLIIQSNVCAGADRTAVLGAFTAPIIVAGGGASFTG